MEKQDFPAESRLADNFTANALNESDITDKANRNMCCRINTSDPRRTNTISRRIKFRESMAFRLLLRHGLRSPGSLYRSAPSLRESLHTLFAQQNPLIEQFNLEEKANTWAI